MKLVPTATALVLSLLAASCRNDEVVAYRIPKEHTHPSPSSAAAHAHENPAKPADASSAPGGAMTNNSGGVVTAEGPALTWAVPSTWQAKAGSAMRKATFAIAGENGAAADLAVTAFPGDVGGEVANVNRWRGQIGLSPLSDAETVATITRLEANGLKIGVVDLADPAGKGSVRMLGAMVPYAGATWFFKLLGPDALVQREKPAFLEFLTTLKPATSAHAAATPSSP